MAGTFGSRFTRSSARAARSDAPPTSRRERRQRWRKICAGAALALVVPLSSAQLALAASDSTSTTSSTTAPASDTTSTTTPAATDTTSTTTPANDTTTPTTTTTTPAPAGPTVTLLVKTKSGLSASEQADAITSHGGTDVDAVDALHLHVVAVPAADAMSALAAYQADANVAAVSVDNTRAVESITRSDATDPAYASQWALSKIGWDQVHGEHDPTGSATLAVLDTGVDASTPDLAGRVVGGWSAFGTDPGADANGHGTHVATIAAAKADDGNGIAGVAYKGVNVMPVQVLGADGTGSDSDIINGLVYAVDHGADVVLMAFSNPGESAALQDAVDYAWAHGVVVVAAAGNDASATPTYPAGLAKVVGVGATDQHDAAATFTNTSDAVFVTAPGTDIAASDAAGVTNVSGTSASAAIVAGSAALLKAEDTSASPATIVGRIARNADPNTGIGGNGRVNLGRAVGDTATDGVTPAGVPGGGGPVVGPYVADSLTAVSVGTQSPNPVTQGGSATFPVNVTNSSGSTSAVVSITNVTGLPSGASWSSSSCVVAPGDGTSHNGLLTLNVTTSASTPVANTSFSVTVTRWTNTSPPCSGTTRDTFTTSGAQNGTLSVAAASPTKLAITAVNGGTNPTAGTAFSVTVQSQTSGGTASNVTTATGVSLSLATGTGTLSGTLTGTIAAGASSTTISGVLYNKAESGVSLTATQTSGTPALTAGTSSTFTVNPGAASKLVFGQQPTSATGGATISPAVTVRVLDANDNLTTSTATVTMALGSNPGGGTLSGTTSVAAVAGTATFSNLSVDKPGTGYTLAASSTGLTGATSSAFDISVGPAAKLAFVQQPSNATAGTAISPAITVQVTDLGGNAVSSSATINMAIGTNPAGGTLAGTTSVAAVSGLAAFSDLSINKSGTGYTLTASSSGLTSATSSTFNITAGTAHHISFGTQPSNTAAGSSISPAVTVQVRDVNDNVVTSDSSTQVTIALGNNPGSSTLGGTLTQTAVNGVATFNNLSLNKTGNGYTLTASATPLSGTTSNSFNITPGAANKLVFVQQPTSTTGGATITPAVTVQILDANDNPTTSTATVTIALGSNPGGGTLSGTTSVAAVAGTATFGNLSVNKAASGYTLAASSSGLTGATSTSFDISVGPAAKLGFAQQPSNAVAGAAISPAVTVQVQDAGGNLVSSSTATVTVAFQVNPGGAGTLSGTLSQDAVGGVATFADLSVNKAATGYSLAASSVGLTAATSGTFNITAAAPAKLAFTTQPSATNTAGTAFGTQPAVTVQDAFGNTVTTDTSSVTLAITSGTGTNGAALTCTANPKAAVAGVATFAGCQINLVGSGYTLTATDGSLTSAVSSALTVNAGTAVNGDGTMTVAPTSVTAGSTGNNFTFTFTAPAARDFSAASYVTVTVPSGWGTPSTSNTSVNAGTCGGTVSRTVAGQVVTVTLGSGCAHGNSFTLTYTGVTAPTTAGNGTFTTASHNGSGGTATALTAGSPVVAAVAGPPTKVVFTTSPSTTTAGTAFGATVQVQDVNNNVVTTSTAPVSLAIGNNPGGGTLSGTTSVNAVNGATYKFDGERLN